MGSNPKLETKSAFAKSSPATLGDSHFILKREHVPLPDKKYIGQTVQSIIDQGYVQKILLQVGESIVVERYAKAGVAEQAVETEIDAIPIPDVKEDLYLAVRNAEMEELVVDQKFSAFECLFRAFVMVSNRRLKPFAVLVNSPDTLRKWLKLDQLFGLDELFGVQIVASKSIPEGSVLLVSGLDSVDYTVRIPVELAK